ncbi:MAG: glycosyltransferase [Acidobacteriia bacterium]|nr:glycosyltransferase [Terriglobia bacterium]
MTNAIGMTDFFVLEAGEYLERLDALAQAPPGAFDGAEEFVRIARAFRGSALMASQQPMARAAQGLESVGRAVRDGRLAWDERVRGGLVRAVDDCKVLLRRVRTPSDQDAVKAEALGAELEKMAGRPSAPVIIILNWNSYEVTLECLLSLRKMDYRNFEVVVVDNGSVDSSAEKLAESVPEIRLIRNSENLGFAGGCNVGMRDALARGVDYVLLLNNDTVVAADFLSQLVCVAESDAKIGVLNPKMYFFDRPDRLNYAGGVHKLFRLFPKVIGLRERDDGQYDQIREVSFLSGCALLMKAEVVRRIGVLEEVYFHFYEDIEWSLRAIQAGFKGVYVPKAVLWHKEHYVTDKNHGNGFIEFYLARNNIIFARKHVPLRLWPCKMPFFGAWMIYRTLTFTFRLDWRKVASLYRGFWSGCVTRLPEEDTSL